QSAERDHQGDDCPSENKRVGPLSAPCDETPITNATISSAPKKVTAALISASSFARFICESCSGADGPPAPGNPSSGYRAGDTCKNTTTIGVMIFMSSVCVAGSTNSLPAGPLVGL